MLLLKISFLNYMGDPLLCHYTAKHQQKEQLCREEN